MLTLVNSSRELLLCYLLRQLDNFFPDGQGGAGREIDARLDTALDRLAHCIGAVRLWPADRFDVLHSSQYATFLYYLANTLHRGGADRALCTKLFLLKWEKLRRLGRSDPSIEKCLNFGRNEG